MHIIHNCTSQFHSCFKSKILFDTLIYMHQLHCKDIEERENANSYNIMKPAAYDRNINQYDLLSCKQKLNK